MARKSQSQALEAEIARLPDLGLAEPIINSLQDDHFTCLNHALMMQLGTIGQAIYMRPTLGNSSPVLPRTTRYWG